MLLSLNLYTHNTVHENHEWVARDLTSHAVCASMTFCLVQRAHNIGRVIIVADEYLYLLQNAQNSLDIKSKSHKTYTILLDYHILHTFCPKMQ